MFKHMKKTLLIAASLFFSILADSANVCCKEEAPSISIAIAVLNSNHFDVKNIEQELDQYVFSTLGFHIRLEYLEYTRIGQIMGKYILNNKFPDVFLITQDADYQMLLKEGYLLPLNTLIDNYGQELAKLCGDQALSSHTASDGICYAIPCIHTRAWACGFEYRTEYAKKYNLDMDSVHTFEDLTPIFAKLKEQDPSCIPLEQTVCYLWDSLQDSLGVLMNLGQSSEIVNLYETEEYERLCRLFSEWREAGYMIDEDYFLTDINSFVSLPETFGKLADYNPYMQWMDEMESGEEISVIQLSDSAFLSNAYERDMWALSADTIYPSEAMRFLNLLYTDPVVANLLAYGIEHEHYEFLDEEKGIISFPDNLEFKPPLQLPVRSYLVGNQYLCYKWNNYPLDVWEQVMAFDQEAILSDGYGFIFDPASVAKQIQDCSDIVNLYHPLLQYGTPDVDDVLNKFQEELKAAGIETIITEKQRQFSLWKSRCTG